MHEYYSFKYIFFIKFPIWIVFCLFCWTCLEQRVGKTGGHLRAGWFASCVSLGILCSLFKSDGVGFFGNCVISSTLGSGCLLHNFTLGCGCVVGFGGAMLNMSANCCSACYCSASSWWYGEFWLGVCSPVVKAKAALRMAYIRTALLNLKLVLHHVGCKISCICSVSYKALCSSMGAFVDQMFCVGKFLGGLKLLLILKVLMVLNFLFVHGYFWIDDAWSDHI